jgi:TfoX/Sxy family transcriptional regulator of competence genes
MAYDEGLADRIRAVLAPREGLSERKMFGGIAFMINRNMACGVIGEELMVRLDHEEAERALAEPHARPMDFTGKPMKGMLYVSAEGIAGDEQLAGWVELGADHAASLPPKAPKG